MTREKRFQFNLLSTIVLFLILFCLSLAFQVILAQYQSKSITNPINEQMENIQNISMFLKNVNDCSRELDSYRWDYSDSVTIIASIRSHIADATVFLDGMQPDVSKLGEEQYLLANAIKTTATGQNTLLEAFVNLLLEQKNSEAANLYFTTIKRRNAYLVDYTQKLLETAILNTHESYLELTARNRQLQVLHVILNILSIIVGTLLSFSLFQLLSVLKQLSKESKAISNGNFAVPDIIYPRKDEVGDMTGAFNTMKHSMQEQVTLLQEKNTMAKELYQKENEALALQNLLDKEKLSQLCGQINPHFLFNTLNIIKIMAMEEQASKTEALLSSLGKLYRYVLAGNDTSVPLSREILIAGQFFSLQKARFGERINLAWDCPANLELTEIMVPPFILQPLIDNAIQHGLLQKEGNGKVSVSIRTEDGFLEITVTDDGFGMNEETLRDVREHLKNPSTSGEHVGLYNIAARLRLLGDDCGLSLESELGKGTKTHLRMPLVEQKEESEELDEKGTDR